MSPEDKLSLRDFTHMLLCYRNGEEWYDVHPLIAGHVRRQARESSRARAEGTDEDD